MEDTLEIRIILDSQISPAEFDSFKKDLTNCGIVCTLSHEDRSGGYFSIDWLIPTTALLFIAKPYVESFFTKMGEDHYESLKNSIKNFYCSFFGNNQTIKSDIVTSSGIIKATPFSRDISVRSQLANGKYITLLFPSDCTTNDFIRGHMYFARILMDNHRGNGTDSLAKAIESKVTFSRNWPQLVYYNPKSDSIELIDYVQSSKQKKIVSYQI